MPMPEVYTNETIHDMDIPEPKPFRFNVPAFVPLPIPQNKKGYQSKQQLIDTLKYMNIRYKTTEAETIKILKSHMRIVFDIIDSRDYVFGARKWHSKLKPLALKIIEDSKHEKNIVPMDETSSSDSDIRQAIAGKVDFDTDDDCE